MLTQKQLNNLPVYTQSEDFLGRITGFEIDQQTHQIDKYYIGSSSWLINLLGQEQDFIISSDKLISLTEEKMTVEDAVIKETVKEEQVQAVHKAAAPAMQKTLD